MKDFGIVVFETIVSVVIMAIGLSGKSMIFIKSAREAVIVLGIVGMLLCTISVGKFINTSPWHPLTICGYVLGILAMIVFLTQVFKWNLPFINNSKNALILLGIIIILKGFVGRFSNILMK